MDVVLITEIFFIFVIFILCFISVLLPLKFISARFVGSGEKSSKVLSLCNSFSGGVFLGTCFMQLIPFIEDKFNSVFYHFGVNLIYTSPVTQLLVMLGFFMILLIEQTVRKCQRKSSATDDVFHMVAIPLNSSESELEDSDDQLENENEQMLNRSHRKSSRNAVASRDDHVANVDARLSNNVQHEVIPHEHIHSHGHNHNHGHNHGHGTTHTDGHGHSHLTDIIKEDFGLRCILLLLALSVHSLFEGIALGLQDGLYKAIMLFIGVAVHEMLVAFAIGVNLAQQSLKISTTVKLSLIFSLTIPIGMVLGLVIRGFTSLTAQLVSASIQGLTAGTFVYVTFLEILPAEINQPDNRMLKVMMMFFGFAIICALKFGMKDDDTNMPYYMPLLNNTV